MKSQVHDLVVIKMRDDIDEIVLEIRAFLVQVPNAVIERQSHRWHELVGQETLGAAHITPVAVCLLNSVELSSIDSLVLFAARSLEERLVFLLNSLIGVACEGNAVGCFVRCAQVLHRVVKHVQFSRDISQEMLGFRSLLQLRVLAQVVKGRPNELKLFNIGRHKLGLKNLGLVRVSVVLDGMLGSLSGRHLRGEKTQGKLGHKFRLTQ